VDDRGVGRGRRILFQGVPETKTVKNRVHLDISVGPEAREEHLQRLVALGASVVREFDLPEGRWTAMLDPEGNELDIQ
jgi:predicted enzyme related to lactoylglutathione lyase